MLTAKSRTKCTYGATKTKRRNAPPTNARKDDHDMHADDAPAGRRSSSGSIKSVSEAKRAYSWLLM